MDYRVERKYLLPQALLSVLEVRLRAVLPPDAHQHGRAYRVRSLYFDDWRDSGMDENEAGIDQRAKYRLRIYGADRQAVRLEIKRKNGGLCAKAGCLLADGECRRLMAGEALPPDARAPLNAFCMQMRCAALAPRCIIEYDRAAFVYPAGNVRITLDQDIVASRDTAAFAAPRLDEAVPVLPAGMHVLEVKYDELLPDFLAQLLECGQLQPIAFSKYCLGRQAVQGTPPPAWRGWCE